MLEERLEEKSRTGKPRTRMIDGLKEGSFVNVKRSVRREESGGIRYQRVHARDLPAADYSRRRKRMVR